MRFTPDDSIRHLFDYNEIVIYEDYNLSSNPVDSLLFDNKILEYNIAQGMSFRDKRSWIIYNFNMDLDSGHKYIENFRGGVQCYMVERADFISSISFK